MLISTHRNLFMRITARLRPAEYTARKTITHHHAQPPPEVSRLKEVGRPHMTTSGVLRNSLAGRCLPD